MKLLKDIWKTQFVRSCVYLASVWAKSDTVDIRAGFLISEINCFTISVTIQSTLDS